LGKKTMDDRVLVVLADDDATVRSALRLILEQVNDQAQIFEILDADSLLKAMNGHCPEWILLDWELPGFMPATHLRQIWLNCPDVVILAMSSHPEARREALQYGVQFYASKADPPDVLVGLLQRLAAKDS
jgi:DNA-binding NarL/FixJ family response regulator